MVESAFPLSANSLHRLRAWAVLLPLPSSFFLFSILFSWILWLVPYLFNLGDALATRHLTATAAFGPSLAAVVLTLLSGNPPARTHWRPTLCLHSASANNRYRLDHAHCLDLCGRLGPGGGIFRQAWSLYVANASRRQPHIPRLVWISSVGISPVPAGWPRPFAPIRPIDPVDLSSKRGALPALAGCDPLSLHTAVRRPAQQRVWLAGFRASSFAKAFLPFDCQSRPGGGVGRLAFPPVHQRFLLQRFWRLAAGIRGTGVEQPAARISIHLAV